METHAGSATPHTPSTTARRVIRFNSRLWFASFAVAAVIVLASVVTLTPLATNDLWVHLSVGRETVRDILAGKGIPTEERFSFTAHGRPLVPHEWLSAVVFYGAARVGGPMAIQILRLLLVLAALAGLARAARLAGARWGATAWTIVILLAAVAPRLTERPHLFSYCLAAWFLASLTVDARMEGGGGSRSVWLLWPALVLWGNLHGGFVIGVFLIGCFLAAALLSALLPHSLLRHALRLTPAANESSQSGMKPPHSAGGGSPRASLRRAARLALVLVGGVASLAILNPAGPQLLRFPFELASMPVVSAMVYEWRSPFSTSFWKSFPFILTMLWAAMLAAGVWLSRIRGRTAVAGGWGLSGALIGLAFAALAARHIRSYADFALLTTPWMAVALGTLPLRRGYQRGPLAGSASAAITAITAAGLVLYFGYPVRDTIRVRCIPPIVSPSIPVAAAEFLASAPRLPAETRLLNAYPLGGYLAWRLGDRARIYVDSRNEAYGEELTRRAFAAMKDVAIFQEEVAHWKPHFVVIDWPGRTGSPVLRRLDSGGGWKLVYLDDWVAIYTGSRAPLPALEFVAPTRLDFRSIGRSQAAAALDEAHRLSKWQPDGVVASALSGHALVVMGRAIEAVVVLENAVAKNPFAPGLWMHLAAARSAAGDSKGAMEAGKTAETLAQQALSVPGSS